MSEATVPELTGDEYLLKVDSETEECESCGTELNQGITLAEIEQALKDLDTLQRFYRKLGRAGLNLRTKVWAERERKPIEEARRALWTAHKIASLNAKG